MTELTSSKTPDRQPVERGPLWWTVEHTIIWEVAEPVLRDEFESRKAQAQRAQIKAQGTDNSVFQHGSSVTPRNVDVDHAHLVPDDDWEVGADWQTLQPAYRFGVGARSQFGDAAWDDDVETRLREDWGKSYEPSTWERVKRAVKRGFEFRRS